MSKGGRLVMIKGVQSNLPTYYMSAFEIPKGVAAKEKLQRNFVWGDAKWIWRFGREDISLWKKVICAKYGLDVKALQWDWKGSNSASSFIKAVGRLWTKGSRSGDQLKKGLRVVVGNGERVKLWDDILYNSFSLKRRSYEEENTEDDVDHSFVWQGICPPKVKVFLWNLYRGRVLVKDVLWKFGVNQQTSLNCLLCREEVETVDHPFLLCHWAWKLWTRCMNWWEDIQERCVENRPRKYNRSDEWKHPQRDDLMFNVDGSIRGSPGWAGMGGVLRDSRGKVLCMFSFCLGVTDSNSVEIFVILRACHLDSMNQSLVNRKVTIVSDSKTAVSWINGNDFEA
ncbi:hypothetical protein Ddye_008901 [Dipteronia dyeriana]|uniref:RNase H type-1 domain-containing protein n=1 Tax=Dipteronia dyeriana TaxID=168575 RepID=A0AAD9XAE4_9ROSI|nr:hypothetical protein Ddye_008901 [Dipteronia dyeriana]